MAELRSGWRAEFPAGLLDPSTQEDEARLKKLAAQQKRQTRRPLQSQVKTPTLRGTFSQMSPTLAMAQLLANQAGVKNASDIVAGSGAFPVGKAGSLRKIVTSSQGAGQLFRKLEKKGFYLTETGWQNRGVGGGHTPEGNHYTNPKLTADIQFYGKKGNKNNTPVESNMLSKLFGLLMKYRPDWVKEAFHDPWGGAKNGRMIGAIGGHDTHGHLSLNRRRY